MDASRIYTLRQEELGPSSVSGPMRRDGWVFATAARHGSVVPLRPPRPIRFTAENAGQWSKISLGRWRSRRSPCARGGRPSFEYFHPPDRTYRGHTVRRRKKSGLIAASSVLEVVPGAFNTAIQIIAEPLHRRRCPRGNPGCAKGLRGIPHTIDSGEGCVPS